MSLCLFIRLIISKGKTNKTNSLTNNILTGECFFHIHNDDRLLLDLIPKMNIFLEYLTVHSEHTSLCSGFWCSLGGQIWQKLTSQWHSVIWGHKGNLYRHICNILFSLLLLAITFF